MKKMILFFGLFLSVTISMAQNPIQTTEIVFDTTTFNYGTIAKGSLGECTFRFVNNSKTPVILTNVHASCGCTTPRWTNEPVNSGKTGEILVKYNTNNVGYFTKTISVTTNLQETPIILTIMGQVIE